MSATPRRAPRLSVPGGLLLALCIFLPAVKGCDKPVYPYEAPLCLGPYLFGLLVAVLALCPPGKKALIAAYSAWTLGSAAALGGAYFFLTGLLSHNKVDHRLVGTVFVCWIPPLLALLLSVRKRGDSEP